MRAYQTLVVGTDGSETSLLAVDRAAALAAESDATLIIATGQLPQPFVPGMVRADVSSRKILRAARHRAEAAGAKFIDERPIMDSAVNALVDLAEEVDADLVVVGSGGLNSVLGRLFSVSGVVSANAKTDVLIVYTSG